jgi:predicted O-methyltransferase YrrM
VRKDTRAVELSTVDRLRDRFRLSIAAHPLAGRSLYNLVFAQGVARLALRRARSSRHPSAAALASAIEAISAGNLDAAETGWAERIEARRSSFGDEPIEIRGDLNRILSAKQLANVSSIHEPWARFLMRLARELRPESCLELGTAIGISAGYQGAALERNRRGVLRSIDRSRPLIGHARELLAGLRITRVDLILGDFDEVLEDVAAQAAPIHMVFLDALRDHDPNLRQFRRLLPHLAPGAALVIDDIRWSSGMRRTWEEISSHERVDTSVDLWRLGACLMRAD